MNSKGCALVTGVTGGIGYSLSIELAKKGYNLILVARNEEKLHAMVHEFEQKFNIKCFPVIADLNDKNAPDYIYSESKNTGQKIDILINNAGFAVYGAFAETSVEKEKEMMQVNMIALTLLTKLFVKDMIQQGGGYIMNVASTAAFLPGPLMAVYYATKAFVLSFSEAIANETSGQNIRVTALCPGPTESNFQNRAAMGESKLVKGKKLTGSDQVAAYGINAMLKGKRVAVPGFMNKVTTILPRFLPRNLVTAIVRVSQDK